MRWLPTAVVRRRTGWVVLARSSSGERRELTCRSEAQARYFAAVLALGPSRLPRAIDRQPQAHAALVPVARAEPWGVATAP